MKLFAPWLFCCGLLLAAPEEVSAAPGRPGPPPTEEAQAYLERGLGLMQRFSLYRGSVDWPSVRREALEEARGARVPADTYPALRSALAKLADRHSSLMTPGTRAEWDQAGAPTPVPRSSSEPPVPPVQPLPAPTGEVIDSFGYISIPGFHSGNEQAATNFADQVTKLVSQLDAVGVTGWLIDLRDNDGGNMWPMLAGIGPVAGEGDLGGFVDVDGDKTTWWYRAGGAGTGQRRMAQAGSAAYRPRHPAAPVALLIGPHTASAGEGLVVSLLGRPQVRSFGQGTGGYSTANTTFPLGDGAILFLATGIYVDRTGKAYGTVIEPDVAVPPLVTLAPGSSVKIQDDPVVKKALGWLGSLPKTAP